MDVALHPSKKRLAGDGGATAVLQWRREPWSLI